MDLALTIHAEKRMQQRGIPPFIIELVEQFGASARGPGGVERLTFDKRSKARMRRAVGARGMAIVEKWLSIYTVVSDETGEVVTAARRRHRFKRDFKGNFSRK